MDVQAEWNRLREVYSEMADGELLELAAKPEELTKIAKELLELEMKARRLEVQTIELMPSRIPEPESALLPGPALLGSVVTFENSEASVLTTLYDALETGKASAFLEEAGIPFELVDHSVRQTGWRSFNGGPPIAFALHVPKAEAERAKSILRERMGLFPLQEVAVADELVDDGTTTGIGWFATAEEAEEAAAALREAGIWYGVRDESSSEDFDPGYPFVLEVRGMDLMKASAAIEESGVVAEVTDLEDE